MLSEVTAYYDHRRRCQSLSTSIIFALSFDPTSTLLASGTTSGLLTIQCLRTAESLSPRNTRQESIVAQHDLSKYGSINCLRTSGDHLFIATDAGVHTYHWGMPSTHAQPQSIFTGVQVNSLSPLGHSDTVVAACTDGSLVCIDAAARTTNVVYLPSDSPSKSYPLSIAASPTDRHCIITGCDDGTVRQYDLRRSNGSNGLVRTLYPTSPDFNNNHMNLKRTTSRKSTYIPTITFSQEGAFIMFGNSDRKISSLHVSSGTIIQSCHLPFLPQSMAFSGSTLYVGGSDRRVGHASTVDNFLSAFDVLCTRLSNAPVSAGAVYTVASHPTRNTVAAAGFTPATSPMRTQRLIDIYVDPPIRSFCLSI